MKTIKNFLKHIKKHPALLAIIFIYSIFLLILFFVSLFCDDWKFILECWIDYFTGLGVPVLLFSIEYKDDEIDNEK